MKLKHPFALAAAAIALALAQPAAASYAPVATPTTANPTSTLTRPANTTAYTALNLIASSTTAGSVVVPTVAIPATSACSGDVAVLKLSSNHTTGLSGISVVVRLWSTAPTYTNGDGGAYAVATSGNGANLLGIFSGTFEQYADGAAAILTPQPGFAYSLKLASGTTVAWDLQTQLGFTPQSGKTFTLSPYVKQDAC